MTISQLELIRLLESLDASAPRVERHLWLIRLMDWIRGDSRGDDSDEAVQLVLARVRLLLDAVAVRPHWRERWRRWWTQFITGADATPLLADLGFAPRAAFLSELAHRLRRRLLPVTPDTTNLGELLYLLLPSELDARWLRALDKDTARRLGELLFDEAPDGPGSDMHYAERVLLDALTYAVSQISAIGMSPDIRSRMTVEARQARPFHELPVQFEALRTAVLTHGRLSAPAQSALAAFREQLDACRTAAFTVYAHLEEHGISIDIEFQMRQLRQRVMRVKALLLCLETAEPVQAAAQLLSHLVRVSRDTLSLRDLVHTNTQLLAAKVTERNAEGGEHYITRNRTEYRQMLRAASGGGAVLAFTTWIKLGIGALGLSAFWGGLAAGLNYALSFVFIMLLHWTVATKQPAMTAPAMAARLRDMQAPGAIDHFVSEVANLLRSQFAAILGNLGLVVPVVLLISLLLAQLGWGGSVMDPAHAQEIIDKHHLIGPTPLFAAVTGLLLFASSLIAGWVENWFVFHRLDSAIAHHPRSVRWLGAARAKRWGAYWRDHISGYTANISLG
ncbi:MAG: recombinase, partial [Comamonadaceae bacterium]|nr:recombinase [Comamonadaceae bacterium]